MTVTLTQSDHAGLPKEVVVMQASGMRTVDDQPAGGSASLRQISAGANIPAFGFYGEQQAGAGNNLGIAVYSEAHITGSQTDHTYGGGFWINYDAGTMSQGYILSPMDNGIYQAGGTLTNVNVFFGGRLEGIITSSPAIFSPFSLNTNNRSITSLFDGAAAPSVGLVDGAFSGTVSGKVPLVSVNGSVRWVLVYTTVS